MLFGESGPSTRYPTTTAITIAKIRSTRIFAAAERRMNRCNARRMNPMASSALFVRLWVEVGPVGRGRQPG